MLHVTQAEYLGDYRLQLTFSDGFRGEIDFAGQLTVPVFESLNEPAAFRQFMIAGHTLTWQNGVDMAPEYLRELAERQMAE